MKCLDQLCNNTALDLSNFCASHSRDTKTSPQHYKNIANDNVRLFKELQRVQEERDLIIDENWKLCDAVEGLKGKLDKANRTIGILFKQNHDKYVHECKVLSRPLSRELVEFAEELLLYRRGNQ